MTVLNGNSESGQNILFPFYFVCIGVLLVFFVVHLSTIRDELKKQRRGSRSPRQGSASAQFALGEYWTCCTWLRGITYTQLIHGFSILSIVFGLVFLLFSVLLYHQFKVSSCQVYGVTPLLGYYYHKVCIYECLLVRLQASFSGSPYAYRGWVIAVLHLVNGSLLLGLAQPVILLMKHIKFVKRASNGGKICATHYPFWGSALSALLDLCINIVLLILFIKPLLALAKQQQIALMQQQQQQQQSPLDALETSLSSEDPDEDDPTQMQTQTQTPTQIQTRVTSSKVSSLRHTYTPKVVVPTAIISPDNSTANPFPTLITVDATLKKQRMREFRKTSAFYKLSIKVTTLTLIMVLSTILSMSLYSFLTWTIGLMFDVVTNCLCLLLMFKKYDAIYKVLCNCCNACVGYCGTIGFTNTSNDTFTNAIIAVQLPPPQPPATIPIPAISPAPNTIALTETRL
ncbi:hypothetical protein RFI_09138 [Reticulomyxa filosa]|uniref:Uncharacterized protein n=1 Tax=Reticulomyxa filosa TaxID=46433 RepID=X6NNZ4_RETFI|nr:hypothetical protein RFI_09138 [Reticulomyxa filosa]|eukprot:ETO27995.1 hypothetical protein RFI_09138 [Reticulomyxa filosa]